MNHAHDSAEREKSRSTTPPTENESSAVASLRELPAVSRFHEDPIIARYATALGRVAVKVAIGAVLDDARNGFLHDGAPLPIFSELLSRARFRLAHEANGDLVDVINGTGILLHTNLGRAPLAPEALEAVGAIAAGYSNLEFDLESGTRGSRYARVGTLLRAVTGAEDSLVVNNCAAAVMLIVDTFARVRSGEGAREVVVSRNQLIEIGGGFRLPDVLTHGGATLVEVGTTNKVYLRDFERALTPRTALLFRSHTSNYRILGFTEDVSPADFAALGKRVRVPTVEDLGSGALVDLAPYGLPHERTVGEAVADGVDLVAFSGDKLLGGPQAGIIVGRADAIARIRENSLLRALRVDKATLAALAATLRIYVRTGEIDRIPLYAMLGASTAGLQDRAYALVTALRADNIPASVEAAQTEAFTGGGTLPLAALPSWALAIRNTERGVEALAQRLRESPPRVVGRIAQDAFYVDLRTIPAERDAEVREAIVAALG